MDFTDVKLNEVLRNLRKQQGLSQQQLADVLKVERSTYAYYETGKTTPDIRLLLKLCRIYDVTLDELLGMQHSRSAVLAAPQLNPEQEERVRQRMASLSKFEQNLLLCARMLSEEQREELLRYVKDQLDFDITLK
ncbi:MAG: helix-turn-helix domain-containing protein [Clostridiales bacterium]|nr:helix-turn-helix domain-containing protein [Clostridiales bacterium]